MDTSSIESAAAAYNHRRSKETERRDKTNLKVAELQQILGENFQRKMSTEEVLRAAYQLVKHLKSVSMLDPKTKGFHDGLYEMKDRTAFFLESLKLNRVTTERFIQNMKDCFVGYQTAPGAPATPSTPGTSSVASSELPSRDASPPAQGLDMDSEGFRKKVRRDREQNRRDRQADAFDELGKFVQEHKISNSSYKIHKLQLLEVIIDFINTSRNQKLTPQDQTKYNEGLTMGKLIGKGVAENYFKNDHHLAAQYGPLRVHLEPAVGLPVAPTIPLVPNLGTVFLPQMTLTGLPILLPTLPVPPMTPLTPPSSSSSDSNSSSPQSSSGESSSSTPVPESKEKKLRVIFRPWE